MVGKSSSLQGVAATLDDVVGLKIDPSGGSSRTTFLAKRECYFL